MILKTKETNQTITILLNELKSIKVVNSLIMYFNSIRNSKKKIILDLSGNKTQTYSDISTSIAGMVDYYREQGLNIEVVDKGYISSISIKEPILLSTNTKEADNRIFDKVIQFNDKTVDIVADSIIEQIKYLFVCEKNFLPALSWCLKEIMDNVINHSGRNDGLVMAQVHHRRRIINISIFDRGRGLLKSLLESGEYTPKNELEAIDLALMEKVSGNRKVGQGNGMWGLKQIVKNNKGHLSIMSGHAVKKYDYETNSETIYDKLAILSEENCCTRIDFSLNFDNRINIKESLGNYEVYERINSDIENMENEHSWIIFNVKKESKFGTGTRQSGKTIRKYLMNIMNTNENKIVLDFVDVDMVSSSFADEAIAQLIMEIGKDTFNDRFVLGNINEQCCIVISAAIRQRVDFFES